MSLYSATWSLQVEKLLPPSLRDKSFDVVNDDFKFGDADNQIILFILESSPGHWKEFPVVGVAIFNYLQSTATKESIQRNIKVQLENDIFRRPLVDVRNFPTIIVNNLTVRVE